MDFDLITIPCLSDNYAFLLRCEATGAVACIDVPEAGPIKKVLNDKGWRLSQVWITHHHYDHVDGLADLIADHPAVVVGASADAQRLPPLDQSVAEGDTLKLGNLEAHVIEVYGHTIGHIAFYVPGASACFTADSLMALGCGRLFEGTPAQMWDSMQKLRDLPGETLICSGHEYTASNAKFALSIDPTNEALISRADDIEKARAQGQPTVPSTLQTERDTNPFLRPDDPTLRASLSLQNATDADVFAEIRKRKDSF